MKLKTLEERVELINRLTDGGYRLGKAYGYYYLEHEVDGGGTERVADSGTKLEIYKQLQAMEFMTIKELEPLQRELAKHVLRRT